MTEIQRYDKLFCEDGILWKSGNNTGWNTYLSRLEERRLDETSSSRKQELIIEMHKDTNETHRKMDETLKEIADLIVVEGNKSREAIKTRN